MLARLFYLLWIFVTSSTCRSSTTIMGSNSDAGVDPCLKLPMLKMSTRLEFKVLQMKQDKSNVIKKTWADLVVVIALIWHVLENNE